MTATNAHHFRIMDTANRLSPTMRDALMNGYYNEGSATCLARGRTRKALINRGLIHEGDNRWTLFGREVAAFIRGGNDGGRVKTFDELHVLAASENARRLGRSMTDAERPIAFPTPVCLDREASEAHPKHRIAGTWREECPGITESDPMDFGDSETIVHPAPRPTLEEAEDAEREMAAAFDLAEQVRAIVAHPDVVNAMNHHAVPPYVATLMTALRQIHRIVRS